MMHKIKNERNPKNLNTNVEFGMEFGDMNASKIYDITSEGSKSKTRAAKNKNL
ncbi:hypothetical protein ACUXCC_004536 [Cytobacillus horneckiae]|uniref:hypothetical protein n=2 Tax=Cytobacillus horneckiae TaxID=549687 RepID=UPI000A4958DE|nr:hypothetical protein [Cytobacillus horneckiae]MBN6889265.1 hypothetical protein [Cytobacillus horneckiae]MCM3178485.1 hypothetical protein [Cytobacillus horneckiae]MEC1156776.1 hypothetical protein [Cytobacillus horneckiae]MED2940536.1 hypothetical protein [Cytobacillus horneckiae]